MIDRPGLWLLIVLMFTVFVIAGCGRRNYDQPAVIDHVEDSRQICSRIREGGWVEPWTCVQKIAPVNTN